MNKLRLTYTKAKASIFLTHEEELKVLERALNKIDVKLYLDNNKNAKIISASPLIYGIESTAEICDVYIEENIDSKYVIQSLNRILPVGIVILGAEILDENVPDISDSVYAVTYEIIPEFEDVYNMTQKEYSNLQLWYRNSLRLYLEAPMILVLIKLLSRNERIDIKNNIIDFEILLNNNLRITVGTDKSHIFNPQYIMDGFEEQTDKNIKYSIKRIKILYNN